MKPLWPATVMPTLQRLARGLGVGFLLVLTLTAPAQEPAPPPAPAPAAAGADEPALSPAEAQILGAVAELGKADPAKAAAQLRAQFAASASAAVPFTAAAYSIQAGRDADAVADLEEALRRAPSFSRARLNLAKVLMRCERHGEAAGHLRQLLRQPAQDPADLWRLLAFALLAEGHAAAAEAAYCQALVWNPDDKELISGLLKSLIDQGRAKDAAPLARAQLQLQPDDVRWWGLLANAAIDAGEPRQALIVLECTRRLGLATPDLLAALGDLYIDQGLYRAAADTYALATPPATPPPPPDRLLRATEALVTLQQAAEAQRLLDALAARDAELTPAQRLAARRLLARLAIQAGQTDNAVTTLQGILAADPLDGEALLLAAEALRDRDAGRAGEYYGRASTVRGCELRALTGLARIAVARQRYEEALAHLQKALSFSADPRLQAYRDQVLEASRATSGE